MEDAQGRPGHGDALRRMSGGHGDGAVAPCSVSGPPASEQESCLDTYRDHYRTTDYFSTGRDWSDYAPAYRCGIAAFAAHGAAHRPFDDIADRLAAAWPQARGASRLTWPEARGAARDAWQCEGDAHKLGHHRAGVVVDDD